MRNNQKKNTNQNTNQNAQQNTNQNVQNGKGDVAFQTNEAKHDLHGKTKNNWHGKKNQKISPARQEYLKRQRNRRIFVISMRILILVLFFAVWQIFADCGIINVFVFSSPSRLFATIFELFATGNLLYHIFITFYEAVVGFLIATVLGFLIAVLLWWNERLREILEPYLIVLNSLPKVALGPIIIIWFGAGTKAIIVMAILIMIIITIISMLNAFIACDKNKILLMKSMGANKWQILFKLIIPNALPEFMSVLKINVGMTWVGTIMGEYLVSKAGLGYLIVYGSQVFRLDLVMASIVILCLLAGIMYGLICIVEKFATKK